MEYYEQNYISIFAGPSEKHAESFAKASGLVGDFVEWPDETVDSLMVALNKRLSNSGQTLRRELLNACDRAISSLPPLKVLVFDDEDEPRRRMVDIAQSQFIPISTKDGPSSGISVHIARKVDVQDHKSIEGVLGDFKAWCGQASPKGLVILADAFAFPAIVDNEPLKVLKSNPKLVDLSAYEWSTILDHTPVIKIHEELLRGSSASETWPLVLPISRIWDQPKVRAIEETVGLPVVPKVMFSRDPFLSEGFARTVSYILTMYDLYLRATIAGAKVSVVSSQTLIESIKLSAFLLRSYMGSRSQLFLDFKNGLWHEWSSRFSSIQRILGDLVAKKCTAENGRASIVEALTDLKGVMKNIADETLAAFRGEDETSVIDIVDVLQTTVKRVEERHRLYGKSTRCEMDLPPSRIEVRTNGAVLHSIVEPILDNAFDAVESAIGRLNWQPRVCCRLRVSRFTKELNQVSIEIKDNGVGIPRSCIDKIYDDEFSTKGEGHGLGLSGIRDKLKHLDIVKRVYTRRNRGTRFVLILAQRRCSQ